MFLMELGSVVDPDPFHFPHPDSKKSVKTMENFHQIQPKSLEYHTFKKKNY